MAFERLNIRQMEEPMVETKKVLFMGSKFLGLQVLKEIYSLSPETLIGAMTIDDSDDTRTAFHDLKNFTDTNNIALYIAKNKKHSEKVINDLKPDLCLVVSWYWLVSKQTLGCVPNGFIGLHNSLLPKLRGGSPLVWSIILDEKEVGFSLFSFTSGMDDGPIWAQKSIEINSADYISTVLKKIEDEIVELLKKQYVSILGGSVRPIGQNHEQATFCAQRFPHDGIIDWQKPALFIYNFIRAQSDPYPGAFTYYDAEMMKVWRSKLFKNKYFGKPGQVVRVGSEGVYVVCGDNQAIILEEVEISGKRGNPNSFISSIKTFFSN